MRTCTHAHTATPEIVRPVEVQVVRFKTGENMDISVEAKCKPGPLEYSWFFDNHPLLGENSPQLSIHSVTTAHQGMVGTCSVAGHWDRLSPLTGQYYCKVTNPSINSAEQASAVSPVVMVEVEPQSANSNGIIRQGKF